jgi:hypothetical protein
MKFKVGDKVRHTPNWSLTDKYREGVITVATKTKYCARVKYHGWIEVQGIRNSELTLLSPVEALLYDWEGDE